MQKKVQPRFDLVYIFCRRFQGAEALVRDSRTVPFDDGVAFEGLAFSKRQLNIIPSP